MSIMKYRLLIPLAVVGALGAGAWYWWMRDPAQANLPPSAPPTIPVDTASVTNRDIPVYLTGLGTVQALNTVTVTSRVDGQLQKVAFTEGQEVKAGDVLAEVDPRPFKAALDQAIAKKAQDTAALKNTELDLQRFQTLYKKGFATNQEVDTQQAQANQLQAQLQGDEAAIENAQTQLDYTTIKAPLDGRTGFRLVDQGNIVRATDTNGIVAITQLHPISVVFTLPEDNLPAIAKAMAAGKVSAAALANDGTELDQGAVMLIDNQIDRATGTARLKAQFDNAKNLLWPGEFVNVRMLLRTEGDALTVPSAAVQRGTDGLFVYVVKPDATVEARPVKVGADTGEFAIVAGGLSAGEQVVVNGQYRLQPGARIRPGRSATKTASASPERAAAPSNP
ncbi:MAG TPA: efflux RND transporter periplasmic adaptor subunit [Dongiaceae bacterium]